MTTYRKAWAVALLGGGTLAGGIVLANYNPPINDQIELDECKTSGVRNPENVNENPVFRSLEEGIASGVIPEPSSNTKYTVTNANGEKVQITWAQRKKCTELATESDSHDNGYQIGGLIVSVAGIVTLGKSLRIAARGNSGPVEPKPERAGLNL